MEDHDFEKQVNSKINELRVQPSPAIWENVEALIKKQRRRRWGIILLFFIMILSGTALILNRISKKSNSTTLTNGDTIQTNTVSNLNPQVIDTSFKLQTPNKTNSITIGQKTKTTVKIKSSIKTFIQRSSAVAIVNSNLKSARLNRLNKKGKVTIKIIPPDVQAAQDSTAIAVNSNAESERKNKPALSTDDVLNKDSLSGKVNISLKENEPVILKDSSKKVLQVDKKKRADKINKWTWGMTFGGGFASISQMFFGDATTTPASTALSGGPARFSQPGKIRSSFGFTFGPYVQRTFTSRVSASMGLNYQNFKTTMNSYKIHYDFIQAPVQLQIQLGSGKIPLYWWVAGSMSALIRSNALQFDSAAIYYQNNSLLNKLQAGISSGFLIDPLKKYPLHIGPYIYYGVSKIAKAGLYRDQHFTFIGLQTKFEFRKK